METRAARKGIASQKRQKSQRPKAHEHAQPAPRIIDTESYLEAGYEMPKKLKRGAPTITNQIVAYNNSCQQHQKTEQEQKQQQHKNVWDKVVQGESTAAL